MPPNAVLLYCMQYSVTDSANHTVTAIVLVQVEEILLRGYTFQMAAGTAVGGCYRITLPLDIS